MAACGCDLYFGTGLTEADELTLLPAPFFIVADPLPLSKPESKDSSLLCSASAIRDVRIVGVSAAFPACGSRDGALSVSMRGWGELDASAELPACGCDLYFGADLTEADA